jgi:hypothetical protein
MQVVDFDVVSAAGACFDEQLLLVDAQKGVSNYFVAFGIEVFDGAEVLVGTGPYLS